MDSEANGDMEPVKETQGHPELGLTVTDIKQF